MFYDVRWKSRDLAKVTIYGKYIWRLSVILFILYVKKIVGKMIRESRYWRSFLLEIEIRIVLTKLKFVFCDRIVKYLRK